MHDGTAVRPAWPSCTHGTYRAATTLQGKPRAGGHPPAPRAFDHGLVRRRLPVAGVVIVVVVVIIVVVIVIRQLGRRRDGRGRAALLLRLLARLLLRGAQLGDLLHDGRLGRHDDRHGA